MHEREPLFRGVEPLPAAAKRRTSAPLFVEPTGTTPAGVSAGAPVNLPDAIGAEAFETFLRSTLGRSFALIHGDPDRFAALLPWEMINSILKEHRVSGLRCRVMRDKGIVLNATWREAVEQADPLEPAPAIRANSDAVHELLRDGATLIYACMEEVARPVKELALSMERVLGDHVTVFGFVTRASTEALKLHWDEEDSYIFQVAGRKRWRVHAPTRPFVVPGEQPPPVADDDEPVWDGILEPGDFLYLPRGWWHSPCGVGEMTVHLNFSVAQPRGESLLRWAAGQLRTTDACRTDLPRYGSREERRAYAARVRSELLELFDDDVLDRYFDDADARTPPPPHASLPWAAEVDGPLPDDVPVRLCAARPITVHGGDDGADEIELDANGRRWRFAPAALPLLQTLAARQPTTVGDLVAPVNGSGNGEGSSLDPSAVADLLADLVRQGLVEVVPERGDVVPH